MSPLCGPRRDSPSVSVDIRWFTSLLQEGLCGERLSDQSGSVDWIHRYVVANEPVQVTWRRCSQVRKASRDHVPQPKDTLVEEPFTV